MDEKEKEELLKKIEENDKDVLISKMEQLADVETATIKGIIVKSKESTKEIIDTYILGIKKHLNAEAEKYGRDISSESITTKKISSCKQADPFRQQAFPFSKPERRNLRRSDKQGNLYSGHQR